MLQLEFPFDLDIKYCEHKEYYEESKFCAPKDDEGLPYTEYFMFCKKCGKLLSCSSRIVHHGKSYNSKSNIYRRG